MPEVRPPLDDVRSALTSAGLSTLAGASDLRFLDDGWDYWAFRAADSVIRLPKNPDAEGAAKLHREAAAAKLIAPRLPLPISVPEVYEPNDGPSFCVHAMVPGVPLRSLNRPAAYGFGKTLRSFIEALQAVPVDEALAAGLEVVDGQQLRQFITDDWEHHVRRVFPLISCEARTYADLQHNLMLEDERLYHYEPRICHRDIDDRNLLADPETGELTGVIDFGDVNLSDPAREYIWAFAGGFEQLGIEDQLDELLPAHDPLRARTEAWVGYSLVFWRFFDIEHGLDIDDDELVREAIERLNAVVPFGTRC
jgi:aminoglycoside phosphotransferase (APT) family kinase protein